MGRRGGSEGISNYVYIQRGRACTFRNPSSRGVEYHTDHGNWGTEQGGKGCPRKSYDFVLGPFDLPTWLPFLLVGTMPSVSYEINNSLSPDRDICMNPTGMWQPDLIHPWSQTSIWEITTNGNNYQFCLFFFRILANFGWVQVWNGHRPIPAKENITTYS